jgi:hypothetical protein
MAFVGQAQRESSLKQCPSIGIWPVRLGYEQNIHIRIMAGLSLLA